MSPKRQSASGWLSDLTPIRRHVYCGTDFGMRRRLRPRLAMTNRANCGDNVSRTFLHKVKSRSGFWQTRNAMPMGRFSRHKNNSLKRAIPSNRTVETPTNRPTVGMQIINLQHFLQLSSEKQHQQHNIIVISCLPIKCWLEINAEKIARDGIPFECLGWWSSSKSWCREGEQERNNQNAQWNSCKALPEKLPIITRN